MINKILYGVSLFIGIICFVLVFNLIRINNSSKNLVDATQQVNTFDKALNYLIYEPSKYDFDNSSTSKRAEATKNSFYGFYNLYSTSSMPGMVESSKNTVVKEMIYMYTMSRYDNTMISDSSWKDYPLYLDLKSKYKDQTLLSFMFLHDLLNENLNNGSITENNLLNINLSSNILYSFSAELDVATKNDLSSSLKKSLLSLGSIDSTSSCRESLNFGMYSIFGKSVIGSIENTYNEDIYFKTDDFISNMKSLCPEISTTSLAINSNVLYMYIINYTKDILSTNKLSASDRAEAKLKLDLYKNKYIDLNKGIFNDVTTNSEFIKNYSFYLSELKTEGLWDMERVNFYNFAKQDKDLLFVINKYLKNE